MIPFRRPLGLLLMLLFSMQTFAQQRSESEAMAVAADFLQRETGAAATPRLTVLPRQHVANQIRRQLARPLKGYALHTGFYVCNAEGGGFVLVGADCRQCDILAYCTEGSFDATDMPCGLVALLEQYNNEYEHIQQSAEGPATLAQAPKHVQTQAVTPLLKSEWSQSTPYNNYCPMDPSTGERCITGCVATAMSQVMYYHRYPSSPADSVISYVSKYDDNRRINISKRLSSYALKWSDMLNVYKNVNYTSTQGNAVASVMSAAGLSVQMSYSSDASSAHCTDEAYALINFFGYNPNMKYVCQEYYTSTDWLRMIEKELTEGRPILYGGHSAPDEDGNISGHAFIVDGMDSQGRCHVNWGWSGQYQTNGNAYVYYALSSFKPGSHDYSKSHEMVLGVTKNTTGTRELVFYSDGFTIDGWEQGLSVGATTKFRCTTWCYDSHANTYHTPLPCYLTYGVVDVNEDSNKLSILTELSAQPHRFLIYNGLKYHHDVTLDAGHFKEGHTYRLYPAVLNAEKNRWYGIHTTGGASNYYVARVKGGKIYFGKMKEPELPGETPAISHVSVTCDNSNLSKVQPGAALSLHAVFKNDGSKVTTDTRVRIFDSNLKGLYNTDSESYTFNSGTQTKVDWDITLPDDIPDGKYYITIQYYRSWGDDPAWIYDKDKLIAFTVSSTSQTPDIGIVSQTCDNSNLSRIQPGERLSLHAVYRNTGATVTTDTRVRIFDSDFKGLYKTESEAYTFTSGTQTEVDLTIKLPANIPDGSYYATIQYYRSWGNDPSWLYFKDKLIAFTVSTGGSSPKEMSVTTSVAGFATFFDSQSAYVLPSGLTAYVVAAASSGSLTYKAIADGSQSGVVPKGVAVMLKGSASKTYKLTSTDASVSYNGSNLLRGSDTSTTTTAPSSSGYLFYKLSYGRSSTAYSDVFGWYWGSSSGGAFTINGHKAWLALQESSTRAAFISLDGLDSLNGLETLGPQASDLNHETYDLSGRRLSQPHRGINIINGKKVVVK